MTTIDHLMQYRLGADFRPLMPLQHFGEAFPWHAVDENTAERIMLTMYPPPNREWFKEPLRDRQVRSPGSGNAGVAVWDGKSTGHVHDRPVVHPAFVSTLEEYRTARNAHIRATLAAMIKVDVLTRLPDGMLQRRAHDAYGAPSEGMMVVTADGTKVPYSEWQQHVADVHARRLDEDPTEQRLRKAEAAAAAALAEVEQLRAAAR